MLRRASEVSMTDMIGETAAHTSVKPASGGVWAVWAATAAVAVLVVTGAAVTSDCRSSRVARPWCPDKYTLSFKRSRSRAALTWGVPVNTSDFADLPRRSDACNRLLNMPRIALLFLARGEMFHEEVWARWFAGAAGLIPKPTLQAHGCNNVDQIRKACWVDSDAPVLEQQFLYNVYVHPAPDYEGPPKGSIFEGHIIPDRIKTDWANASLTVATRHLLRHALRDPHAQQFLMLSDTGLPLYPATTVYLQLMSESRSRINACDKASDDRITGRPVNSWNWKPKLQSKAGIQRKYFRKHTQWVGLRRPHAEAIIRDERVFAAFQEYCVSFMDAHGKYQQCKVDEHYFSTLLAMQRRDQETDCKGGLVTSNWEKQGRHPGGPYEYYPKDINTDLFMHLRNEIDWGLRHDPSACIGYAALELGRGGFVSVSKLTESTCPDRFGGAWAALSQECPLFARKFPADTRDAVLEVLSNATNVLQILP